MLLNDEEIRERIESPLNLLNRLRTSLGNTVSKSLPHPTNTPNIDSLPPKSDDLIENLEDKLAGSSAKSKALGIMNAAMDELKIRIPDVQKPEKLAAIAAEMAKVVNQQENKGAGDVRMAQVIVYAPQMRQLDSYDIVELNE